MFNKKIVRIFLSFLFIFGCENQITSICEIDESQNINIMAAQFNAIQQTIIDARCVTCRSGNLPSGGLNLSSGTAYTELISKNLVIPGNSSASLLLNRLDSNNPNIVMPPSGKIAQVLIDSVAAWIDKGAHND